MILNLYLLKNFLLVLLKSENVNVIAVEYLKTGLYNNICYQCFIVENKIEILWHIKQLFLQKESLQILIIYTNNSFSKNKILI